MQKLLEDIADFINKCLGPLGSDGFTWNTIRDYLIQLAAIIILFLVIRFCFWNKITAILEEKQKTIDEAVTKSQESRANAMALEADMRAKYAEAENEVRVILAQAEASGNNIKENIVAEAKAEAKRRLENAELEINNEITAKNEEIKKLIVDVAFMAAKKIVSDEIDQERYLSVVNEIIEEAVK